MRSVTTLLALISAATILAGFAIISDVLRFDVEALRAKSRDWKTLIRSMVIGRNHAVDSLERPNNIVFNLPPTYPVVVCTQTSRWDFGATSSAYTHSSTRTTPAYPRMGG